MDDERIIELYWKRDPQALLETQGKYGPFCQRIALNILSIPEDAEECVNDVWHKTWDTIPPARPAALKPWLGRVVRNLSISRWRWNRAQKRGAGAEILLSELSDCVPCPERVEAVLEGKDLAAFISDWLRSLPGEARCLFLRRYWYGEDLATLASESGLEPRLLSSRLFRLRQKLKTALEKEGISL